MPRKVQFFYIKFNGAWVENPLHISSSENRNMLSNAICCPDRSKNLHRVVFHHGESKLATTPGIQTLRKYVRHPSVYIPRVTYYDMKKSVHV